jgi:hypothetical protein
MHQPYRYPPVRTPPPGAFTFTAPLLTVSLHKNAPQKLYNLPNALYLSKCYTEPIVDDSSGS